MTVAVADVHCGAGGVVNEAAVVVEVVDDAVADTVADEDVPF